MTYTASILREKRHGLYLVLLLGFVLLTVLSGVSPVHSIEQNTDGNGSSPYQAGFPAQVSGDVYDQIKVTDLDGDGTNEMVFGATDGCVHVINHDGTERRNGFWPKHTGGPVMAGVEVGDINKDGASEVVASSFDGKVYALTRTGFTMWNKDTGGSLVLAKPELADINGDKVLDIIVGSQSKKVFAIDRRGQLLWENRVTGKVSGPVVVKDLDGDDTFEVIAGTDDGWVNVIQANGGTRSGWPKECGGEAGFFPFVPQVADLDEDGEKEIIIGSPGQNMVTILSMDGKVRQKIRFPGQVHDSVNIADIDGDGHLDLLAADDQGYLSVVNLRETMQNPTTERAVQFPGWPRKMGEHLFGSPRVSDIDGDGLPDIIYTAWNSRGEGLSSGSVGAVNLDGTSVKGFPKETGKSFGKVSIADLDNDGDLELIVPGGIGLTGKQIHVYDCPGKVVLRMAVVGVSYTY
ncbi:MAG: hypothetical protein CVV64_03685 [Candidatus Wallbacteria bacterium HGW-Wallbacteria-1]|jgi:hypothetical protein|uniref:Lambda-carrageenase beta-propeller domain-containing protein n=1 Tax=Candidatus Wallbacteria bacterium HGW-Wallbacteria-1 TaxID=2013854 RepID=A0A2N1PTU8_9BACT|nr:MAG: hypothetical protein CVV64_03685 [Candidatus Wallbacteria bacterium HGW-Wallbacteria-1]